MKDGGQLAEMKRKGGGKKRREGGKDKEGRRKHAC
jgi:hypothetical protein